MPPAIHQELAEKNEAPTLMGSAAKKLFQKAVDEGLGNKRG